MKDGKARKIVIGITLLIIVEISIFYTIVSTSLRINGNSAINKLNWDVHFDNIQIASGSVTATLAPSIEKSGTELSYDVDFYHPGEFYEFTVDIVNSGSLDAELSADPIAGGVSQEQSSYISYIVMYSDGNSIKKNDLLNAGERKTLKVRVEYKKNIIPGQVPKGTTSLDLTYKMSYVQSK